MLATVNKHDAWVSEIPEYGPKWIGTNTSKFF
jgi:hypothetical protein